MGFDILDLATLPALALLCAVTSVEDVRTGKIRNKWIALALLWGAAAYAALSLARLYLPGFACAAVANTLFDGSWTRLLWMTALNSAAALVCGFLIFHLGYWSAGDAKLFFAISLLLPLKYYFNHFLPVFPSFGLFLNVITVAALYVWAEASWGIFRFVRNNPQQNFLREIVDSTALKFKNGLKLFLAAAVVFCALMVAASHFGLSSRTSLSLNILAMTALLFGGGKFGLALEGRAARLGLYAVSALFFAAVLASPLRLQAAKMVLYMSVIFSGLFLVTAVLPGLAEKYGVQKEDMPFAVFLAAGAVITAAVKGSLLYLLVL